MQSALVESWGNASSIHAEGQTARGIVERARRGVAAAVNAPPQAVVLCGGATEGNNQVLRHHVRVTDDPHVVCTAVEHPSVLEVVEELGRAGVRTSIWPVDEQGRLDPGWLQAHAPDATLVSVMLANNEMGNVYPVAQIAARARELGAEVHVDATQGLGRISVDAEAIDADYMTLSFHKCGGPKGIGAIILREGRKIEAILAGGHQERGRRPGTENVPAAAGLLALTQQVAANVDAWNADLEEKRGYFLDALRTEGVETILRGDPDSRLPNTLNVAFGDLDGEDVLLSLDLAGVAASSGSACTAGSLEPSHVILAMGHEPRDARRSVRLSFGPATTKDELAEAARRIAEVVDRLGSIG